MKDSKVKELILEFIEERDWEQFHNPKDVALSLTLEAAELLEHFQWKSPEEIAEYITENKEEIEDEIADVYYWIILICHYLDIDLEEAAKRKMKKNKQKYPAEKAKGKHLKYTRYVEDE